MNVLERIDALCALLNLAADDFRDKLASELGESDAGSFTLDDLGHLLADGTNL